MDLKGKRFLLIGGAGFIGSHTADALLQEDVAEARIFDLQSPQGQANLEQAQRDPRLTRAEGGDIRDVAQLDRAMQGIDGVFDLAALWLLHCIEHPRQAFDVNVAGTFNILESCVKHRIQRLVYSSSASVYGEPDTEVIREDHPFNNKTFYGATKIASEQMCRAFYHRHLAGDGRFDYVGLRYMNVYGTRQGDQGAYASVIMKMLARVRDGKPLLVYGDGSQSYDFVHVADCARANVCAMKSAATDAFYNVGMGRKTSILELAKRMVELAGSKAGIQFEPGGTTFVRNRIGDPQKAADEIGFRAQVPLDQGLKELIDWYILSRSRT